MPHHATKSISRTGYSLLMLQGVGMLFPYNAFITSTGYYQTAFAGTRFAHSAEGLFVLAFTVFGLAGLLAGVVLESLSLRTRVVVPLLGQLALFLIIAAITPYPVLPPVGLFTALLLGACVCALLSAALQGGILAFTSTLPPIYTNGVISGQALSGLVVAVANFLILYSQHQGPAAASSAADDGARAAAEAAVQRRSACAYYLVAASVMAACIGGYSMLVRMHANGRLGMHGLAPLDEHGADDAYADHHGSGDHGGDSHGRAESRGSSRALDNVVGAYGSDGALGGEFGSELEHEATARRTPIPTSLSRAGLWHRATGGGGGAHRVPTVEPVLAPLSPILLPLGGAEGPAADAADAAEEPHDEAAARGARLGRSLLGGSRARCASDDHSHHSPGACASARGACAESPRADIAAADTLAALAQRFDGRDGGEPASATRARVLGQIGLDGCSVFVTFAVTLSLFPAVTARVPPRGLGRPPGALYASLFTPGLFVLFNFGDLLGRWVAALARLASARKLLALAAARLVLVPLLVARALDRHAAGPEGAAPAVGDAPVLVLLLILGVSNGYVASCAFMSAPQRVQRSEMEWVGRAMPLFLNAGLTAGSLCAFALERIVETTERPAFGALERGV